MSKNTIREKFEKEFGPDFKEGDIDTERITEWFIAEFDSLLEEKVEKVRQLKGYCHENNCMAFTEKCENCLKYHYRNVGISDALSLLTQPLDENMPEICDHETAEYTGGFHKCKKCGKIGLFDK